MTHFSTQLLKIEDPILKKVMDEVKLPVFLSTENVFHDVIGCIIEQQIHYRSTKKIFHRLLEKSEIKELHLENFAAFEEKAIPTLKLSMNKLNCLHEWELFTRDNSIKWLELDDNEVREQLSKVKGIGNWTKDMILLYTLQRPNIFPVDDFHLKQVMTTLYGLNPNHRLKAQMLEISETWEVGKSLAVLYLLEWKKLNFKKQKTSTLD
ncbi:MAG: hypothetical protein RL264_2132 [Bacteroidota bacterium]|jgi:DNA-3-methyladenine glycosylase II